MFFTSLPICKINLKTIELKTRNAARNLRKKRPKYSKISNSAQNAQIIIITYCSSVCSSFFPNPT